MCDAISTLVYSMLGRSKCTADRVTMLYTIPHVLSPSPQDILPFVLYYDSVSRPMHETGQIGLDFTGFEYCTCSLLTDHKEIDKI